MLTKLKFFNNIFYNIGGQNFSLNDIEHGILRNNDNFNGSLISFAKFFIFHKEMSDRSEPRFKQHDPRYLIVQELDPRIHFALNCG